MVAIVGVEADSQGVVIAKTGKDRTEEEEAVIGAEGNNSTVLQESVETFTIQVAVDSVKAAGSGMSSQTTEEVVEIEPVKNAAEDTGAVTTEEEVTAEAQVVTEEDFRTGPLNKLLELRQANQCLFW